MASIKYAKRSISLPVDLDAELERRAANEGTTVSALLADAAERSMRISRGLAAVAEWKVETGTVFTAEEVADADALLDAAGVGHPVTVAEHVTREVSNRITETIGIK